MPRFIGAATTSAIMLIVVLVSAGSLAATPLVVEVKDSRLEIEADEVPLGDILAALAAKTGLVIQAGEPLVEPVSCRFTDLTLEEGIKRLMKSRSYALVLGDTSATMPRPPHLFIAGKGGPAIIPDSSESPVATEVAISPEGLLFPDERKNVHSKDWFAKEVLNREELARQLSAAPSHVISEGEGIVITDLATDSLFCKIGLSQGDVVSRVNGQPVGSAADFIEAFQSIPEQGSSIMMIERRKPGSPLDPLYVHLD